MLKAYKYRIYPNKAQEELLAKTFGCCRFVYNQTLAYRKKKYEKEKKPMSRTDCNNYCNRELKAEYEWLREVDKFALTNAIYSMDSAYQKFFKEHAGYPKFRSKHDSRKSYTTNFTNGNISVDFDARKIKLPKLKQVRAKLHRKFAGQIKSVTVSQVPSGKYYVSVLVETEHEPLPKVEGKIGLDLGIKDLCVTSDGRKYGNPKIMSEMERKLIKLQRQLAHKERGSSISDVSWYELTSQLMYKAEWNGRKYIKIDTFYASSQLCSVCGCQNTGTKDLSVRKWKCPKCGAEHDRDINAAKYIGRGIKTNSVKNM